MLNGTERTSEGVLFHFSSTWTVPADLIRVWNAIGDVEHWPEWWTAIRQARNLKGPLLPVAVGNMAEYMVASPLGYWLTFRSEVTKVDTGNFIDSVIRGELSGMGRWEFHHRGDTTSASLLWDVAVHRSVLARLASVGPIRSTMSWAHDRVMDSGERGLKRLLLKK